MKYVMSVLTALSLCLFTSCKAPENQSFNGLNLNLGNLSLLSDAETRSISPENFSGEKGQGGMLINEPAMDKARDLGQGWKVSPFMFVKSGETATLAEIDGSGALPHSNTRLP